MRSWNRLVPLLLVSLVLAACVAERNKLFQSPCAAPCWYGVTPGETTESQLRRLIPSFPYYQQQESSWWERKDPTYGLSRAPEPAMSRFDMAVDDGLEAGLGITLLDDVVARIEIRSAWGLLGQTDLGLSLGEALALYGEPSRVMVGQGCGGDQFCLNLYLIYPDVGVVVATTASIAREDPLEVQAAESLRVRSVALVAPDDMANYLEDTNSFYSVDCLMSHFSAPWQGPTLLRFSESIWVCDR